MRPRSSSGNFYGSEIWHEIFWGINFGPVIFSGFDFWPHSIIPVTWNPEYPSWVFTYLCSNIPWKAQKGEGEGEGEKRVPFSLSSTPFDACYAG